jgi:glycosyltransferase involved in cell wall biosynthesis
MAKKKVKTNISVIIPVHELNNETEINFLKTAVTSVEEQEVKPDEILIVVPKGSKAEETVKSLGLGKTKTFVKVLSNPGKTDFSSQMNYGVSKSKNEWFSLLEFDDEYNLKWFKNVIEYREAHEDIEIFMPIIIDVNEEGNGFMGLTNEAVWANSFSDELGILDNNALLSFQNFNIDGLTMRKDTFENNGGLKSNLKLTFTYEFLLRLTFNGAKTMVIPKYGYKHVNQREGSLFASYKDVMNPVEANWWLSQAKKEYFHSTDRELNYEIIEDK